MSKDSETIKSEVTTSIMGDGGNNNPRGITYDELENVSNMNYMEYVAYLKKKHGEATVPYMTKSFCKNSRISRTKEGLLCHHVYENDFPNLSNPEHAKMNPYEYQQPENLVYCNLLEHLLLHIKIAEEQVDRYSHIGGTALISKNGERAYVGITGIVNYMIPQLNDYYCGYLGREWEQNCFAVVKEDKDIYFEIVGQVVDCIYRGIQLGIYSKSFSPQYWEKSYAYKYGSWDEKNNLEIVSEINELFPIVKVTPKMIKEKILDIIDDSTEEDISACIGAVASYECGEFCPMWEACSTAGVPWIMERYFFSGDKDYPEVRII